MKRNDQPLAAGAVHARVAIELFIFVIALAVAVWSARFVKRSAPLPLVAIGTSAQAAERSVTTIEPSDVVITPETTKQPEAVVVEEHQVEPVPVGTVRYFDGRPMRVAKTLWMKVTAYSPDARSCGIFADGNTATLHSVWTNGMNLAAADTRILPFGSVITVPGYAGDNPIPVLDRGGAIKGHDIDLLMPTHEMARKWGVKMLPVTVWEYADGKPAPNPRKLR